MADARDEALRRRYRELATEEPPAALDDAIRAAARRAVSSGPGKIRKPGVARWAVPASVAAVLFLSFTVVMRLEKEAPPIAEPTPSSIVASKEAAPAAPSQVPVPANASGAAVNAPLEAAKEPEARVRAKLREQPNAAASSQLGKEKKDSPVVESKTVLADAIAPAKVEPPKSAPSASPMPATPPAPPSESTRPNTSMAAPQAAYAPARVSPAAPTAPPMPAAADSAGARASEEQRNVAPARRDEASGAAATGMLGAQATTQQSRAKSEAYAEKRVMDSGNLDAPWPDTPEKKLERIEALRKAGRDKEADEALARFKREHPAYEIPEATWQRIKPR